jgi:DNA-binding response OmpR family regulator
MPKKTCLLIDDDEDDREIFQIALEQVSADLHCVTLKNGVDAVKMLSDKIVSPDFIFLDINMPLMNGKECLMEIRKLTHLKTVPVFMYTTSTEIRDKEIFLGSGASDILTKPAKISELVKILNELIVSFSAKASG